ncbi:MAG: hypothetical protein ABF630_09550 [Liquorilactobacillus sp.]
MIKDKIPKDYNLFKNILSNRPYLTTNKYYEEYFKKIYALHFFLYNLLSTTNETTDSFVKYINLAKRDVVISLDLLNCEHFESAKRNYRSVIESLFRVLCYSIKRHIYIERKKKNIYNSSDQLKRLQSMLDTHKVSKLTYGISEELVNSVIKDDVKKLNSLYSEFSNIVHTSDTSSQVSTDLNTSIHHESSVIKENLDCIFEVLTYSILVSYFSILLFSQTEVLSQQDFYYFVHLVDGTVREDHIINISKNYNENFKIQF